ncbi:MAG: electron transfer flavoprotein subunit beta/FixA family protein [Desulfobacteraceae bacterium]|nr:electron transfer flavoprotein subunit beta/FixA family protein [Desulfobacteraceae bacterium]
MQIYVCVKHVPDSAVNITILDKCRIDQNVTFLLNPYDEHAVTEAVRIRDAIPGSEVIAVCLGKDDAEKTLRSALAMGADKGLLITSDDDHDSIETARALKAAMEFGQTEKPALIFTGKESIDAEGMQTMFRLGALFDFPVATNVVKVDIKDTKAVVDQELSGGNVNTYELSLPCVIGAGRGLNTPKYPTFPDIVKSRKRPVEKIAFADLNISPSKASISIVGLEPLKQTRNPEEITGDASLVAQKILTILKQEAKVI